jgi:hypothetical protein
MARTLSDRLSEAASGAFVGRADELRALTDAVRAPEPPFAVTYIYGPGGIGKSSFLRAVLDALPKEYLKLSLDCREVEPTADGALTAISGLIGGMNDAVDIATLSSVWATRRVAPSSHSTLRNVRTPGHLASADIAAGASCFRRHVDRQPRTAKSGVDDKPGWSGMFSGDRAAWLGSGAIARDAAFAWPIRSARTPHQRVHTVTRSPLSLQRPQDARIPTCRSKSQRFLASWRVSPRCSTDSTRTQWRHWRQVQRSSDH